MFGIHAVYTLENPKSQTEIKVMGRREEGEKGGMREEGSGKNSLCSSAGGEWGRWGQWKRRRGERVKEEERGRGAERGREGKEGRKGGKEGDCNNCYISPCFPGSSYFPEPS